MCGKLQSVSEGKTIRKSYGTFLILAGIVALGFVWKNGSSPKSVGRFSGNLLFELLGSAPPIPTHEGGNQWSFDTSPESLGFPMSNHNSLSWAVSQR